MNSPTKIEYDSDQTSAMTSLSRQNRKNGTGQGGIIGFLISKGIVKNEKIASYFLLGVAVLALILTFYMFQQILKGPQINPIVNNYSLNKIQYEV